MAFESVLILDDSPDIRSSVNRTLTAAGYEVFAATTAEEAESHLNLFEISFAVVDLYLEGDEGPELSNNFIRNFLIPRGIPYLRPDYYPQVIFPEIYRRELPHQ